jgi:hypothetical protein
VDFAGEPGMAVAWAQLFFNVVMSLHRYCCCQFSSAAWLHLMLAMQVDGDGRLTLRAVGIPDAGMAAHILGQQGKSEQ